MKYYTIKKGKHRAWPLTFGLYLSKKTICREVIFHNNCRYQLGEPDQQDINKLFGIAYVPWYFIPLAIFSSWFISLFRNQHHQNSARFGWRFNENLNKIEIFYYCYVDGERIVDKIALVSIHHSLEMELFIGDDYYEFEVRSNGIALSKFVMHNNKKRWGYPLGVYFGGNKTAPHTMNIEMEKL